MSRENDLELSLRKILDMYTNLRIIYSSEERTREVKKARILLGDIPPSEPSPTQKEMLEQYRWMEYFDINIKCFRINKITPISHRCMAGMEIELKEGDVGHIIAELYEIFGEDMLIDFIKNG